MTKGNSIIYINGPNYYFHNILVPKRICKEKNSDEYFIMSLVRFAHGTVWLDSIVTKMIYLIKD